MMKRKRNQEIFDSLTDVLALVRSFELGTLPRSDWNHVAHLAVAMWYLAVHEAEDATKRMIQGIQRYNLAQGIVGPNGGYHETITRFWFSVAQQFHRESNLQGLAAINAFVARFGVRGDLLFEHYSRQLLFSSKARSHWVEPDLKPLPFPPKQRLRWP